MIITRYRIEPGRFPSLKGAEGKLSYRMIASLGRGFVLDGDYIPADIVPVIAPSPSGAAKAFPMIWGITGKEDLLAETDISDAPRDPRYSSLWQSQRCLVPASYYCFRQELRSGSGGLFAGDEFLAQPSGDDRVWMAGLYRIEDGFPHFIILTRMAAGSIAPLAGRMPVILDPSFARSWLACREPANTPQGVLSVSLTDMVTEPVPEPFRPLHWQRKTGVR